MRYQAISADSHINEAPDLWETRLPAKLRERGPRVIDLDNGGQGWVMEDLPEPTPLGMTAVNYRAQARYDRSNFRKKFQDYRDGERKGLRFDDILPGSFDPRARVVEQQEDGVDAEVLYQGPMMWASIKNIRDPELKLQCFRAYNDWIAEFQAHDPARLIGVGLVPSTGVDDAIAELRRCFDELKLRSVTLESYPNGSTQQPATEDDKFWAVAEEYGKPIAEHANFSFTPDAGRRFAQGKSASGADEPDEEGKPRRDPNAGAFQAVLARLITTGVFDRFPDLTFVGAEVNCGWIPHYLDGFDRSVRRNGAASGLRLELLPSEYFRRNVKITFITDPMGVEDRYHIGVDNMMWCSDFPHSISSWPIDVEMAIEQLDRVDVPASERERILWKTCADLYGLPYES